MELIQACSQMADRISALEAEKAALEARAPGLAAAPSTGTTTAHGDGGASNNSSSSSNSLDLALAQLRVELAEALRSKGTSESRLRTAEEELSRLRSRTKLDSKSIRDLQAERNSLATKVNDREYELREKRKLVEQVQDEMITLNLQLSMAEKERDRVKRENKELVDRWMKRMEQEADAMNLANEPRPRHP
ncbi:Autophagy protein 16 [Escovopsis weberi]|uniref:Autophagy protein 16 n=1 Tax=Escovopsis weberi TaxID=150374 RepID=A0A0M8MZR1_ESCWE|nr:Autophagy protein 16 [Escovopsis weberi]